MRCIACVCEEGETIGGGPSQQQLNAAQSQADLNNQLGAAFTQANTFQQAQQQKANPFYTSRMQTGLPYFGALTDAASGTTAQAFAPARAQLEAQIGQGGNALPSGFADQARTDLAANQARAFDTTLQGALGANEQAKQVGASGLLGQAQIANPVGFAGAATQGNASVMNAPLAKPGLGGLLGGVAGGLASAVPF